MSDGTELSRQDRNAEMPGEFRKKKENGQLLMKFCESPVRKTPKEACNALGKVTFCDTVPADAPKPLLAPVTLLNYSSTIPIMERAALVHKALRRRRGKVHRVIVQDNTDNEDEVCEETDEHLWDVSDLGIKENEGLKENPVILRTKKTLSELGRDTMIGSKFRKMLTECLHDWRLTKEVYATLSTVRSLRDLFQNHSALSVDASISAEVRKNVINEILGDENLLKLASRSFECRMLVKTFENDYTMAGKLAKCTEVKNILDEADKSDLLKRKIFEINKNFRKEVKRKAKETPMSPWVDLPQWFALLTSVKNKNPPRHVQPFLLIDWSMENKTASMYRFHQEYKKNVDRRMLEDFVTETALLVSVEDRKRVNETLQDATFDCDMSTAVEMLDEAIAHREGILDEIEGVKAYLKKVEDIDDDGLNFDTLYEKPQRPERRLSFENMFSNDLRPMNACELLDETIRPKMEPSPSPDDKEPISSVKAEAGKGKYVMSDHQIEKKELFSKYARLSVDRIKPLPKVSSKTFLEVREDEDEYLNSTDENTSDLRITGGESRTASESRVTSGPGRIRFAPDLKSLISSGPISQNESNTNELLPKAQSQIRSQDVYERKHSISDANHPTSAKTI